MMDELISIIIPAYNIQDYLEVTLDSVLAQTYKNLEVIVVNDGSRDGTADVMNSYAARDNRVKAFHKENGGVTSARLYGLSKSTGSYIGFVDGDDLIEPQMYQRLLQNLKTYNADISHCGYQMVYPSGRIDFYYNTGKMVLQDGYRGCTDLLEGTFVEPGLWNKLYRRELFVGLDTWMDRNIRINEDLLMNFYLFRRAETTVFEDVCPYHYMLRKGSAATSQLNEHKLWDPLRTLQILQAETREVSQWNVILDRRLLYAEINAATMGIGRQKELIYPFRKEVRKALRKHVFSAIPGKACNTKLKIMALWAAIWPTGYRWVHILYAKCKGTYDKYNLG